MKWFLTILLSIVGLLVVGGLVGPNFVDWNQYKAEGQAQVKKLTGYDVALDGDLRVSLFPSPHLIVKNASVKAPVSSREKNLASIGSLEIYVALSPLLQGNVEVRAVNLVDPVVALEVSKDGTPNWLTQEVKALQSQGGQEKEGDVAANRSSAPEKKFNVSFDNIRIKDGRFQYYDAKTKSLQVIEDVNIDLSAESLQGPFRLDGRLKANGMAVGLDISVPDLDLTAKSAPVKLAARVNDMADLQFAGVVDFGDTPGAQGETVLAVEGLRSLSGNASLPDDAGLKGFVTADAKTVSFKDLSLSLGQNKLGGKLSVGLSPLVVQADVKAQDGLDLAPLIPKFDAFDARLNMAMAGGVIEFRDTRVNIDGQSVALSGAYESAVEKSGRAQARVVLSSKSLDLDKLLVKEEQKSNSAKDTGASATSSSSSSSTGGADVKKAVQAIKLPLDVAFDVDVARLKNGGRTFGGVKAKGAIAGDQLSLKSVSVADLAGSSFSVKGNVQNFSTLSGLSLNVAVDSADIGKTLSVLGQDKAALPKGLKSLSLKTNVKGDVDVLNFTTNVKAMGGSVLAKGVAKDALDRLSLSDLVVQVKHPNMSKALQSIAGGASYPSLAKPLDFYTKVSADGDVYSLTEMSADLAGTPMKGDLAFDMSGKKPSLKGKVSLGNFTMMSAKGQQAAKRVASGQQAVTKARTVNDRWSSDAIDGAFLHAADVDLSLAAKSLRFDNWSLSKPSLKIVMKNGKLDIQNLSTGLYGGTMNLDATVQAANNDKAPLSVSAKAKLRNVDIEQLTTSLAAGSKLVKGKGRVSLDADIQTSGRSQKSMVGALSGKGLVSGSDIVLEGVDVSRFIRAMDVDSKPGDSLLSLWKGATNGKSSNFKTLQGDYTISRGIVNIASLDLDGEEASIDTKGVVNLPAWTIKTDHVMVAKNREDVPEFEMSIEGSLDNPGQTFAQGPLENYLSKKINRKLEKVLGDKLGKKLDDKLGNELGGALGGVLNGVLGGGVQNSPSQQQPRQEQPANDNTPAQQQQPQEIKPEEAIEGLLKGLLQ